MRCAHGRPQYQARLPSASARKGEVIGGKIQPGEGIVASAVDKHQMINLAFAKPVGSFEHHVFKEV